MATKPRIKTVGARAANQGFSRLLADVRGGKEVIITRRGVPVARLVPINTVATGVAREKAIARAVAMMKKGFNLGGLKVDRDEIYDRHKWRD